ncbi:unnamed protein product, partial [Prorocentrum cordatum]
RLDRGRTTSIKKILSQVHAAALDFLVGARRAPGAPPKVRRPRAEDGGAERVRGGGKKAEPRPHRPPLGSTALAAKAALVRQGASPRGRADVAPAAVRWPPTIRASRPRCCVPPPVERLCSAAVR